METNTARNFALQLGSLITLYVSLVALTTLTFGIINILFPDILQYRAYDGATNQIRFGIAMLFVFFPMYIFLTRKINIIRREETHGTYHALTKWLIYLSLLIGGLVLLGDLVSIILAFLNGELTTQFTLKTVTLLAIIGTAFTYYTLDAMGYWNIRKQKSKLYALVVSGVVIITIIFGFTKIELPQAQRAILFDQERIANLQTIQSQINEFYRAKQRLPENIEALSALRFGLVSIVDPETNAPYDYTKNSELSFSLCAYFNTENKTGDKRPILKQQLSLEVEGNWNHSKGNVCFDREIDPDFLKPLPF